MPLALKSTAEEGQGRARSRLAAADKKRRGRRRRTRCSFTHCSLWFDGFVSACASSQAGFCSSGARDQSPSRSPCPARGRERVRFRDPHVRSAAPAFRTYSGQFLDRFRAFPVEGASPFPAFVAVPGPCGPCLPLFVPDCSVCSDCFGVLRLRFGALRRSICLCSGLVQGWAAQFGFRACPACQSLWPVLKDSW